MEEVPNVDVPGDESHEYDLDDTARGPTADNEDVEEEKQQVVGKREDTWVLRLRAVTAAVLVVVAITTCALVYVTGRNHETKAYRQEFSNLAEKLVLSFEAAVKQRFEVLAAFSDSLTAEANGSFPFHVPSDFSERSERVAKLAEIMVFHILPIVTRDQLEDWNTYSVANDQWRPEGMARERGIPLDEVNAAAYEPYLYNPYIRPGENVPTEEINPSGPYFPIWLSYPVSDYPLANLDLFADWEHIVPLNKTAWTGKPVFEYSYDYLGHVERDIRWDFIDGNKFVDYHDDPHATATIPVFDKFGKGRKVAAVILIYIYWRTYFDNLLPPGADGVIVVLENSCNQTYTYQVDGAKSYWLGRGDMHDAKYNFLEAGTSINNIIDTEDVDGFNSSDFVEDTESDILYYDCFYNIRVYPSEQFEERYRTSKPLVQACTLAGLFLFTLVILVVYDNMVERRQKLVLKSAMQSGKLVSALFPEEVRQRLYEEQKQEETKNKRRTWMNNAPEPESAPTESDRTAIATLYPETTVFFGDIVGFTAWSSKRTPAEVFTLLEGIYGFFDNIARKRKVFKVETIGDCYVAVTGLPEAQENHATSMCRFANQCLSGLGPVLSSLSETLGDDTNALAMRVGLHSGPVTAGVLRGEKSRFQLFGDTVNMGSRMESNGCPSRIHVSQATADCLTARGKGNWLTQRGESIVVKGKGEVQTYFVNISAGTRGMSVTSMSDASSMPTGTAQE